ncbi:hypothetical protein [Nonomuraea dietziae]
MDVPLPGGTPERYFCRPFAVTPRLASASLAEELSDQYGLPPARAIVLSI